MYKTLKVAHMGPGNHPSGSPQEVHGGDGGAHDDFWRRNLDAKGYLPPDTSAHKLYRKDQGLWGGSHSDSFYTTGASAEIMGIDGYKTTDLEGNQKIYSGVADGMLDQIASDETGSEEDLYHGFQNVAEIEWQVGDIFKIPLIATAGDPDAVGYGISGYTENQRGESTLFVFPKGTKMVAYAKWKNADATDFGHVYEEAIVAGEFRVTSVKKSTYPFAWQFDSKNKTADLVDVTIVNLEPTGYFDTATGTWRTR